MPAQWNKQQKYLRFKTNIWFGKLIIWQLKITPSVPAKVSVGDETRGQTEDVRGAKNIGDNVGGGDPP